MPSVSFMLAEGRETKGIIPILYQTDYIMVEKTIKLCFVICEEIRWNQTHVYFFRLGQLLLLFWLCYTIATCVSVYSEYE